jgi:hypothetical protein
MMRAQLVGPMHGIPGYNYPAFNEATSVLRGLGYEVFNPAETAGGDTERPVSYYMRASLGALLRAERVVTLPGWQYSDNARLEVQIALALDLPVVPLSMTVCDTDDEYAEEPDD